MKKVKLILLISSIGLLIFGLNAFFDVFSIKNKTNSVVIMVLSIINFVFLIKITNKNKSTK